MSRGETAQRLVGGRYTLLEPLGQGGMGTVWRARDELLRREVAVKHVTLPPAVEGADPPGLRQRVMREAQAAARLSHPGSVTVFDVLEDEGSVHIVMELLDAETLAETVGSRGPLEVDEAARIGLELVGALDTAHRLGIVHRDVKPGNVMLLRNGGIKLADFGIARVQDDPGLTGTGQVIGSPSYMAPEQAMDGAVGPAADWWGLGATLYYAVEGRPPFERAGALPTLTAVVNDDPTPAERAGPLASLLGRLLAKDPALRPDASELRTRLRALAEPAGAPRSTWSATVVDEDGPAAAVGATRVDPAPPPVAPMTPRPAPAPAPPRPAPAAAPPRRDPAPARRPSAGDERPGRGLAVAALLAGVALLVALLAWTASRSGDEEQTAAGQTAHTTEAPGDPETTSAGSSRTAAPEGASDDWVTYTDPKVGYRIAHPPGWQVRPLDGTRTDITDPATGTYLRVDWTDTPGPSPEGAWESLSKSFGARHEAYEEIRIDPTTYKGFDAAEWEYEYTSGGARLHAVNLGMVTGRYGFALNFQAAESRWDESQDEFEAFKASFQVPS